MYLMRCEAHLSLMIPYIDTNWNIWLENQKGWNYGKTDQTDIIAAPCVTDCVVEFQPGEEVRRDANRRQDIAQKQGVINIMWTYSYTSNLGKAEPVVHGPCFDITADGQFDVLLPMTTSSHPLFPQKTLTTRLHLHYMIFAPDAPQHSKLRISQPSCFGLCLDWLLFNSVWW